MLSSARSGALDQQVAAYLSAGQVSEAYQHILTLLGPGLLGYLRAATRSDLHADEIYDWLRLTLYESLPSFSTWLGRSEAPTPDSASSVRAWLYRCARNRLIDWTRRASRGQAALPEDSLLPGLMPRLSTLIQERQRQALVTRALDALTDAERDALVLRAERGLSFKEVGEVLGISPAAAKERYHRAKERLRQLLAPTG